MEGGSKSQSRRSGSYGELLLALNNRRLFIAAAMGVASGLPFLLAKTTLKTWLRESGVDLASIGFFALAGLPYTLKFLWAPLLDRYAPGLGRRRGWMLIAQGALMVGLAAMSFINPANQLQLVAGIALWIAFWSATQDVVIDAYRRESLTESELGLGSALYVYGYRLALWMAKVIPLFVAQYASWSAAYLCMSALMGINILTTIFSPEPQCAAAPSTMRAAVVEPLREFFSRSDLKQALLILAFVIFFKFGDSYASVITAPFFIDVGFSKAQIASVDGTVGFFSQFIGLFLGGFLIYKLGIYRSLWICGFLQMVSTAGFSLLAVSGPSIPIFSAVLGFENTTSGMGTAAFVAFMGGITDKRFTAVQYALLSSLAAVPMSLLGATSGLLAEQTGWSQFFIICTLAAIPGLALLHLISSKKTTQA